MSKKHPVDDRPYFKKANDAAVVWGVTLLNSDWDAEQSLIAPAIEEFLDAVHGDEEILRAALNLVQAVIEGGHPPKVYDGPEENRPMGRGA